MNRYLSKLAHLSCIALIIIAFGGCTDSDPDVADEYLIRLGNRSVTVLEFNEAFEIDKIAHPHHIRNKPADLRKAQARLLNQMTIELIVLERAAKLGIELSEAEVEKHVAEIKKDYPEGIFEETLLEVAVSYETWVKRLTIRLIMEKVIDKELNEKITITPKDIAAYYEENIAGRQQASVFGENHDNINEAIIKILRRKKLEEAYGLWINDLRAKYTIEINQKQWENISGAKTIGAEDLNLDVPQRKLQ
jgi:hypothetical protein